MSEEDAREYTKSTVTPEKDEIPDKSRFSADEEAALLKESEGLKLEGNRLFASAQYTEAITGYDRALSSCPNYLEYEVAVLRSNIAACHLKLQDWKAAVESATKALEALDRLDPPLKNAEGKAEAGAVVEVDEETAEKIEALERSGKSREDVQKLRAKALMRRAKGRMEVGGWSSLVGAEEDYRQLAKMPNLSSMDQKTVKTALVQLPPRLEQAKNKEMSDMMGKLKQLGNGILSPFGLSTDNFQFVKDEKTGGYSMNFNQNAGGKP